MSDAYNHVGVSSDRNYEDYACNMVKTAIKNYKGSTPLLFELFSNDIEHNFSKFSTLNTGIHKTKVTLLTEEFVRNNNIPVDFSKKYLLPDEKMTALNKLGVNTALDMTRKFIHFTGLFTTPYKKFLVCDADMLFSGDLNEIFSLNLGNNLIAACEGHFYFGEYHDKEALDASFDNGLVLNKALIPFSLLNVDVLRAENTFPRVHGEAQKRINNISTLFDGHNKYIGSAHTYGRVLSEFLSDRVLALDNSWSFDTDLLKGKRLDDESTIKFFKETPPKMYHFNARESAFASNVDQVKQENKYIKIDFYNFVLNNLLNDKQ
jgi:lipopolysaccharide biosynthesis glycosyltransferase